MRSLELLGVSPEVFVSIENDENCNVLKILPSDRHGNIALNYARYRITTRIHQLGTSLTHALVTGQVKRVLSHTYT